ncbi:IS481 family transposase [Geomonas sp.]|uniref:IS481 family transposase n=1 Tax=Geomonas sp. TaxID=2651584 RepID=UPI002B495FD1|nr:IS481 family transposase [Geomonas sp.]HJV34677.1 IS481 family transposase [Geomonas sp.]
MPWQEVDTLTLRTEFVMLATREGCNISQLCRHFGISRDKGYKWLRRFAESGAAGLENHSRKPHNSPNKTDELIEEAIINLRRQHPAWGGRKLKARLEAIGFEGVPAPSTITAVLHRHGLIDPSQSSKHTAYTRFEHDRPNALWQIDYKGPIPTHRGQCHPLTALDDHSRFNVVLLACPDETARTVINALTDAFRRYGLPDRMTMDNGSPWGGDESVDLTVVTAWLIRLGIGVSHSRPYHPQTQGKDERFHRTLLAEAIAGRQFRDLADCQRQFDLFRDIYNLERPHESLGMKPPVTHYQPSSRSFPETLPPIEYGPDDLVRKVQDKGEVFFSGKIFRVPRALKGQRVAFRLTNVDGRYGVYYCHHKIKEIDLKVSPMSPNTCNP